MRPSPSVHLSWVLHGCPLCKLWVTSVAVEPWLLLICQWIGLTLRLTVRTVCDYSEQAVVQRLIP